MKTKIITFWSPVKRQGGCSTNVALYASYLSGIMDETEKAVIYSLNENADATDYLTSSTIRNGGKDLLLLSETNNVNYKEDVLAYTHKLSDNLDILGTGKEREIVARRIIKMIEILTKAYDYILIDSVTDRDPATHRLIGISDLIVVCVPQDKFVYEELDMGIFENKKVIFLSSMHSDKNELSLNKIQAILPAEVYMLSRDEKINQAMYKQNLFGFVEKEFQRKSKVILELDNLHKEIKRLINIESLNISYELKKNSKPIAVADDIEAKVIKEYKFIKTKNNIMIINLSPGAGSTFVSLNLAYMLKERKMDVSVIELPHKEMKADILNIISSEHEDYISVAETIKANKGVGSGAYIKNGIKFYVNNNIVSEWSNDDCIEYLSYVSKDNINIYDIGSQEIDENIGFLLNVIDIAIVIVDPAPFEILQTEERIKKLKALEDKNINVIYVLNKYIKDLNKKDIERYLQAKITSAIPYLSPETMYAAYYSDQVAYNFEKSETFKDSLLKILNGANIIIEEKKESKKFKLFNWR